MNRHYSTVGEIYCGSLAHPNSEGLCVCDEGYEWDHSGQCGQVVMCDMNEVFVPYQGTCMCVPGAHRGFGGYCWADNTDDEQQAKDDYTRRTGKNPDGTTPFSIFDPGTWFSTITSSGELSEPVFVPEGGTPPANAVIVSPPALERPFGGEAPATGPRPLPGQGEAVGADGSTTPSTASEPEKISPWVWVGGAAVLGIAGWMLFGKSDKK